MNNTIAVLEVALGGGKIGVQTGSTCAWLSELFNSSAAPRSDIRNFWGQLQDRERDPPQAEYERGAQSHSPGAKGEREAKRAGLDDMVVVGSESLMSLTNGNGETFGEWLLRRPRREDAIADLVSAARADPRFPRQGSPDDVRKRLNEMQANGDMHAVVDDAEVDWKWG